MMIAVRRNLARVALCLSLCLLAALPATRVLAAPVTINGNIDLVNVNISGVFSSLLPGTTMSGSIDDVTFSGMLAGGGISQSFSCCINAGGRTLFNDIPLDAAAAMQLNTLTGTNSFSQGDIVDGIDMEGDATTANNTTIEIGVSYLLDRNAFSDTSDSNYPFNPADLRVALFFIEEYDAGGNTLYHALGLMQVNPVPVPPAIWLFGSGLLGLVGMARRRKRSH